MSAFTLRDYPLNITNGDTETLVFNVKDSTGVAIDFTGYSAAIHIQWNVGRYPLNPSVISAGGEIDIAGVISGGTLTFTIPSDITASIPPSGVLSSLNNCQYKIVVTSGSIVETIIAGPLKVYDWGGYDG